LADLPPEAGAGPASRTEPRHDKGIATRLGFLAPLATLIVAAPAFLREGLSVYDGGLFLTMSRFIGLDHLVYRDLWTLYGPGPPILGSVVMGLFGPGLGPIRVVLFLVHVAIVAATFLVARRFTGPWMAGALAALVAAVGYPVHFQQTIALLLWGLWFVLRAVDDDRRAPRRLAIAALLFGLSFWGRFEFVVVGVILVLGLWIAARGRVDERSRRRLLLLGLAPPALFLVYLTVFVGWDRAWLNLVEYPFFRYSDAACRGLPGAWPEAARALSAPFRGHLWTTGGLVLWTATFVAPILGVLCLVVLVRGRRELDRLRGFAIAAAGALVLILWLEHRPRASLSPNPVIPLMVVAAAVLLGALAARRPRAGRWTGGAVAFVILLTVVTSTLPAAGRVWTDWPPYDRLLGWEGGRVEGLYDERVWSEVVSTVRSRTEPGEEIFVALTDNRFRTYANAPIFYWFADRPPASRFIEFDPCLTDTASVQREIVGDLAAVDVVIVTTFFPDPIREGPAILDGYLSAEFAPVYSGELPGDQAVTVLERRS
jgi:hypothetical protein